MKYLFPKKIKASSNIANVNDLLKEDTMQVDIDPIGSICFQNNDYVIFDFGKELNGGIRLLTSSISKNGKIRLRFGESLTETCIDINEETCATNDHALRDFEVKVPQMSDQTFGQTGFRFVRIDFSGDFWNVQHIIGAIDVDDREEVGTFKSDDQRLNDIWNIASYTLRVNLHNGVIWDGAKRDRLCWIGDAYNEIKALECLYNEQVEIKNVLEFTIKDLENIFFNTNTIPTSYTLWWIIILLEKYKHDDDDKYLQNQVNILKPLIKRINSYIDENGSIKLPFNFVDWPTHCDNPQNELDYMKLNDEEVGVKALTLIAFKKLKKELNKIYIHSLDEDLNSAISKLDNSTYEVQHFKQVAALVYLASKENGKCLDILTKGKAKGLSTFQSYTILSALARLGKHDEALEIIKEYYGKMIDLGATTFFEDFDIDWANNAARIDEFPKENEIDFHATYGQFCYKKYRHSLAHGWAVGVIPYIVENVIGLKQISKNHFELKPNLSSLNEIHYIYPHEYGKIEFDIKKINDHVEVKINGPKGIKIELQEVML